MLTTEHAMKAATLFQNPDLFKSLFFDWKDSRITCKRFGERCLKDNDFFDTEWSWGRVAHLLAENDIPITEQHFEYYSEEGNNLFDLDNKEAESVYPFFQSLFEFMIIVPKAKPLGEWL